MQTLFRSANVLLVAVALLGRGAQALDDSPAAPEFHGKLSELREAATVVGEGWQDSPGLVIEDLDALPEPPKTREDEVVASVAAPMRAAAVMAMADYTYMAKKRGPIPDTLTVRVLVFRNGEAARKWWAKKYDPDGPGKDFYRPVEGLGDRAVDSTQAQKRIALSGNVLITCSQLQGAKEYPRVIARYVEKLAAQSSDRAAGRKQEP